MLHSRSNVARNTDDRSQSLGVPAARNSADLQGEGGEVKPRHVLIIAAGTVLSVIVALTIIILLASFALEAFMKAGVPPVLH